MFISRCGNGFVTFAGDCGFELINLAHFPRFTEQTPVHARKVAVSLAQFGDEKRHPLDVTRIFEFAGVDVTKWRALDEPKEILFGRFIVPNEIDIAEMAVKFRLIENFEPNILECTNDLRFGET